MAARNFIFCAGVGPSRLVCAFATPALSVGAQSRFASTDVTIVKNPVPTSLKRGRGGRSSFSGIVTTVFGASGFIGRYVCNRLGKIGSQVIIPYRGDHYYVRHLKVMGDLGQILFMPYHLRDEKSIQKAVKHSNVVINLVGRDWETMNFTYEQVHVEGAHRLAKISKEMGVEKFIHLSALNCTQEYEGYVQPGGSKFLKTKLQSEEAVRSAFPEATIFRPSDVYGQEDRFLRYYGATWRRSMRQMPLPHKGVGIWKQPVYVGDLAQGICNAIIDPRSAGVTYEALGPRKYELKELVDWFYRVMRKDEDWGYKRTDMKWDPFIRFKAKLNSYLVSWPLASVTYDKIEREAISDTVTGVPTLEDLGVVLTKIEDRIEWELGPYKAGIYYEEDVGEFKAPTPPKYITAN